MSAHRSSRRIIVYGFMLVVTVLVAITGIGLYRINNLSYDLTEIVKERDVQIALMHAMRHAARERSMILQSMMIIEDPFIIDDYAMQMSTEAADYVNAREKLLSHKLSKEERKLLDAQHKQTVKTGTSQNRIINNLRNEHYKEAAKTLFYTTLPGQRHAMSMMDKFIALKRQQNIDSLKSTNEGIRNTYRQMLLLGVLGLLFSTLIALIIHRRISNEIDRRLESENYLRQSELRERTIRENIIDGLLTLDQRGNILSCNKACKKIFGYERSSMEGRNAHILMPQAIANVTNGDLSRHLEVWEKRMIGMGREVMGRRSNGENFPAEIDISKIEMDGKPLYIVVVRDITEKKQAERKLLQFNQELERRVEERTNELARTNEKLMHEIHERVKAQQEMTHLATHDTLTTLPNRALFTEHLDIMLHNAKRHQRKLALLFIDLDGFKKVNDTYGHDAGDQLLKTISERMRQCIRKEDIIARMGGDEFTILLGDLQQAADANLVAKKLIRSINEPVHLNSHQCHVGASIGIALYPGSADEPDALLRLADDAMYAAKADGKNTYTVNLPAQPTTQSPQRNYSLFE